MPFQEITLAVCGAPTRPMPQPIAAEPTRLSAAPSTRRPTSRLARLSAGQPWIATESSMNSPLAALPAMP